MQNIRCIFVAILNNKNARRQKPTAHKYSTIRRIWIDKPFDQKFQNKPAIYL